MGSSPTGAPSTGAVSYNFGIFVQYLTISQKRCKIGYNYGKLIRTRSNGAIEMGGDRPSDFKFGIVAGRLTFSTNMTNHP